MQVTGLQPARRCSAQVSLGVIDEAVYAIRPDDTPDPVRFFYRREYSRVGTTFSRDYYFTGFSGTERLQLAARRRRPFTLADFKGDKQVQPQVRKDFPDAIYWISDLVTDAHGQAKVSLKYPDALTTWRLTARAVTRDTKAGVADRANDDDERSDRPRHHPAFPDRRRSRRRCRPLRTTTSKAPRTPASHWRPRGSRRMRPVDATTTTGSISSGGERRDDWRFRASTVGTASVTATARTDADADAVELPIPVLPYGLSREAGSSGSLSGAGEHSTDVTIPATVESGRANGFGVAGALDGRLPSRRARLSHDLSLRLHRTNALELPAQCRRHPRAQRN